MDRSFAREANQKNGLGLMPVSKLKCTHCKQRFPREQMISINAGNYCSDKHILEYALAKSNQKRAKAKIQKEQQKIISKAYGSGGRKKGKTKKDCENDLKTRKKAAKEACHAYIRERDKGQPCICCNNPINDQEQAGHYLESGNNPQIRYDEDNIHLQALRCNYFKGGDSGSYRINLINKIGLERVERLESMKGGAVKRTPQDYKEIELYYKQKLKSLLENSDH